MATAPVLSPAAAAVFVRVAVRAPLAMKHRVFTIDLILNRALPQIPWPLVQPFPIAAPKPTSKPPRADLVRVKVWGRTSKAPAVHDVGIHVHLCMACVAKDGGFVMCGIRRRGLTVAV